MVRIEKGGDETEKARVTIQMTMLNTGTQLCLKTTHALDFKLHEPINVFLAGTSWNGVSATYNPKIPKEGISPQVGDA